MTDERPTSDSGSSPLDLERLESQLRALPAPAVPEGLSAKLVAGIPSAAATGSFAAGALKSWIYLAAMGAAGLVVIALLMVWSPQEKPVNDQNPATKTILSEKERPAAPSPLTTNAISRWEEVVRFDPFNADAWFSLAKAQADAKRPEDAIASVRKALDIARAANRSNLVRTLEAWIRDNRPNESTQ